MLNWLDEVAGPSYAPAILWTLAALLLLLVVLVAVRLIRSMTFGTYVAGGRNRKTRLAVMDATAVDSHRRLVLVRRDDIEHLLLIGGPTDVVVERDIRLVASRRPNPPSEAHAPSPTGAPPPRPQPVPPRQGPPRQPQPSPLPAAREASPAPRPATPSPSSGVSHASVRPKPVSDEAIDDALLSELEVSLEEARSPAKSAPAKPASLDDEMAKLLGELSSHKR